jgi:septum site-determining protein MinC
MSENKLQIKGFREGLLIKLGEGDWDSVSIKLLNQMDDRPDFFRGAKISIDVGERSIHAAELGQLRDRLSERGVSLFAIISKSPATEAVAESLGLSTHKSVLKDHNEAIKNALVNGENAVLIQKTLRSGASIKYSGHVIIDGDVNPGAEIIAEGSIYVWGKLRGSVSAGVGGLETAVICALDFNPERMRIANIIREGQLMKLKIKKSPQKAVIHEKSIIISDWKQNNILKLPL